MKRLHKHIKFIVVTLLIYSFPAVAQYDTSLINRAIAFLHTDTFKNEFRDFVKVEIYKDLVKIPDKKTAKKYKSQQEARMNFWLRQQCFFSDSNYYLPDHSLARADGLGYGHLFRFDTIPWKPSPGCLTGTMLEPIFFAPDVLELRNFQGKRDKRGFWLGESKIIRLQMKGYKPKILHWYYIIHN